MEHICNEFMVGKNLMLSTKCGGQVVLAPDCVYLAILGRSSSGKNAGLIGGLVGGLVDMAVDKAAGVSQINCITFGSLPEAVKADSAWKTVGDKHDVIVLSKEAITELKFSWLSGVKIATKERVFHLGVSPFGIRRAKRKFRDLGWDV